MSGTSDLLYSNLMELPLKRHSSVPRRFKPALISPELLNKMKSLSDHTRHASPSLLNSDRLLQSKEPKPVKAMSSKYLKRQSETLFESTSEPKVLNKLDLPFRKDKEEASMPIYENMLDNSPLRKASKSIYSNRTASPEVKADILNQLSYIKHMKISMDLNRDKISENSIFDILARVVELLKPFEKILGMPVGCPLCGCKNEEKLAKPCEKATSAYEVDLSGRISSYTCQGCKGEILTRDSSKLLCEYCSEKDKIDELEAGSKILIMKISSDSSSKLLTPKPPSSENARNSNPIRQQRIEEGSSSERTHRIRPVSANRSKSIYEPQTFKVTIGGIQQIAQLSKDSIFRIVLPSSQPPEFTLNCEEFKQNLKSITEVRRKRSLDLPLQISSFNRKIDSLDKLPSEFASHPDTPNFAAGQPIAICIK